ncbi:MAG: hypothetical protein SFV81_14755 [Pirellulaceae bacterium]|nr:hypothetical protein [Pirellulaceae bacterium]
MICRSWAAEALQGLQPADAADATKILEQLVRLGRLTDYQADLLAGKRQGEFKKGAWTLLRPVNVPLWEGWFEATKAPNEPATWVRWLSSEQLAELQSAAPSLPRGLRMAQIKGAHLQGVQIPELIDKQLQLQVQPIYGVPLSIACQQEPNLSSKSAEIVRRVAEALKPLHAVGLAHGRVLPDRVYWHVQDGKGMLVTLARDPICSHTASLDPKAVGAIRNDLNGLSPTQFMAPEFLAPGQLPTPNSDIYSLGCLWWWLVTGKPLVEGSTFDKQLARQAEAAIALPRDCALPAPFVRCLQHCLAKNLPARFETAEQLCQALDAASVAVAKGPVLKRRGQTQPVAAPVQATPVQAAPVQSAPAKPVPATEPQQAVAPKLEPHIVTPAPQLAKTVPQPTSQPTPAAPANKVTAASKPAPTINPTAPPNTSPLPTAATLVNTARSAVPDIPAAPKQAAEVQATVAAIPQVMVQQATEEIAAKSNETPPATVAAKIDSTPATNTPATNNPAINNPTNPNVNKPGVAKPSVSQPGLVKPGVAKPGVRKKVKRKPANKWALPVLGGLAGVCVLLGILIASGVMKPSGRKTNPKPVEVANAGTSNVSAQGDGKATASVPEVPQDPRLELYRIVPTGKDLLWAPPTAPKPIALDLLPPGGQIFITLRPNQWLTSPTNKSLLAAYNEDLAGYLDYVSKRSGVAFDSIDRLTIAVYAENELPMTCMRVQLVKPQPLSDLKAGWGSVANEKADTVTLLSNAAGDSYYVAQQPLSDAQSVSEFSFGPTALMKESAELQGAPGPLVSQLGKLWQVSDADADLSVLLTSSFLFSEGKSILANMPKRLASRLRELLEVDSRAVLIQTRLEPAWYVELQLIGLSEREAPRLSELMRRQISSASTAVEEWFVSEQPHPYWRPLAIRYPQMLRTLAEQSRFGVEGGAAIANAYLPSEAAANILLSTWIASQDGATLASDAPAETVAAAPTAKPLSIEEYLARTIKLSFDQEPIETALRLVGDEANANLPAGTPQLRFALDGGAFERAGITRNQQLRDFKHVDLPMRDALTAIAKRGNPVTTVKDTHEEDQRLIWVVRDDPENPGKQMISLTTRAEAAAKNIVLPTEFAPVK